MQVNSLFVYRVIRVRTKPVKIFNLALIFIGLIAICLGNPSYFYCSKKGEITSGYSCGAHSKVDKAAKCCCVEKQKDKAIDCCFKIEFKYLPEQFKVMAPNDDIDLFLTLPEKRFVFIPTEKTSKAPSEIIPIYQPNSFYGPPIYLLICKLQC